LHCNRIDDEKGAFQFMDISQSPYTQGATYLSVSPKLFLVRLGVKVGIANDNPQEMLDVTGNVKAVKFIGDGSLLTNLPTGTGGTVDLSNYATHSEVTTAVGTLDAAVVHKTGNEILAGSKTFTENIDVTSITTARTELVLKQTGDDLGTTAIEIKNRFGVNGIQVINSGLPVVDVGVKNTLGTGMLMRLESRPEYMLNPNQADGEFQVKAPVPDDFFTSNLFSVGRNFFIVNNKKMGVNTRNPSEALEVNGNVKATMFIGDGSLLTNLPTGAGGASVTIEQDITSNSTTSVPSVSAVKSAINAANNHAADIVNTSKSRKFYTDVKDAVVESVAGDTINLYTPLAIVPTQDIEAYFYLKGDVNLNLYGVKIVSPDTRHDIITFAGSSNVINGFNSTLTQLATGDSGSWFIGTYGGVTANATINNLNLDIITFNSVGFALYGNGMYNYSGNINSSGKYVVKLAPPVGQTSNFTGTGNIVKHGTGYVFWLTANLNCNVVWSGNIAANDTTTIRNGGGILTLREGILHATNRPAGSELVFTNESTDSVLVLENYSVFGIPSTTVIKSNKVILRGNTTVVGNIESPNIIDERPGSAISGGSSAGLYSSTGQAVDGAMTQKATTDALTNPYKVNQDIKSGILSSATRWSLAGELRLQNGTVPVQPYPAGSTLGMRFVFSDGTTSYLYEYLPTGQDTGNATLCNWSRIARVGGDAG
jgi:hypothetical protein